MPLSFLQTVAGFEEDAPSKAIWNRLSVALQQSDGFAYYKHPVITSASGFVPDLVILARGKQPLALRCLAYQIDEIDEIHVDTWIVDGSPVDPPNLQVDDFAYSLSYRFQQQRLLRSAVQANGAVALPNIQRAQFEARFGAPPFRVIWRNGDVLEAFTPCDLDDDQWRLAASVFQMATPLYKPGRVFPEDALTMGAAIRLLERDIALLDQEQLKVAHQIPDAPQQIRGLAGTGKTVLLAMKAANIHLRHPDKKILFTFYTQSLYNQVRTLIEQFYRVNGEASPNWDKLHIRHAWGGRKPGVYSELCKRQGVAPMSLPHARAINRVSPFQACCQVALSKPIEPEYDFILMDEAQDFPSEFFRILYQLTPEPHAICWAFDEMQNLSRLETRSPEELFGNGPGNKPLVTLEGEHPSGIERDLVLQRSYRCPGRVLMLAHSLGLGIYSTQGCVQMLRDEGAWKSVGYEVEQGPLRAGRDVVIRRPQENSPNRIENIYHGDRSLVTFRGFVTAE
jgi:hypothetical protein